MLPILEFQSTLHRTPRDVAAHIAEAWLQDAEAEYLAARSDTEIADEAIEQWGLMEPVEVYLGEWLAARPWLETRGLTRNDLIAAVAVVVHRLVGAQP